MRNVRDYGAFGDGVHSDTKAIQDALDAGGTVLFPPGRYLSGSIYLRSHGGLHLEAGAELVSGDDSERWNAPDFCPENRWGSGEGSNGHHLIIARECEDISITGGRINGSYMNWMSDIDPQAGFYAIHPRNGQMIYMVRCKNIRIKDCELVNSPYWNCFLHGCQNAQISNLRIFSDPKCLCNDGIDIDCCQRVTVSDCLIDTGDDAITLRGDCGPLGEPMPCEHITVTDCVLTSRFADGVRVGVGDGLIRHAVFSNLSIHDCAIGIELTAKYGRGPGGTDMEDIRFQDIVMEAKRGFEIKLNDVQMDVPSDKSIRRISFRDISGKAERSSRIVGNDSGSISDILFADISLDYHGVGTAPYFDEHGMWCSDSSDAAFEVRHASNVRFRDILLRYCGEGRDGWHYGVSYKNAPGLSLRDCEMGLPMNAEA
ncbi:MAG: right-handed parallel beta-helix repeat-containing protein [Victivallales bacterium]|nr:right-handed parallel beta-helix repeat-containing protein [Victivallales bacterium]